MNRPVPTTFEELHTRKEALERSIKLNKFNMERSLDDAKSELPKFMMRKVAVPAGVVTLGLIGIAQLKNFLSDDEEELQTETVTFHRQPHKVTTSTKDNEITFERTAPAPKQQVKVDTSPSILHRLWLVAMPFLQPYIKDFVKNKIKK